MLVAHVASCPTCLTIQAIALRTFRTWNVLIDALIIVVAACVYIWKCSQNSLIRLQKDEVVARADRRELTVAS